MNIYRVTTFDGYSCNSYLVVGYDIVMAIQSNGYIIQQQVIKVELVGSQNETDLVNGVVDK